jgi:hypothetical protein
LKNGEFIELDNIYEGDKKGCFRINPSDYVKYHDDIAFICHSHTDFDFTPSIYDMITQKQSGVPWIIVSTNGVLCKYIIFGDMIIHRQWIGLEYVHGASDCYQLVKNWFYHHKSALLPDFPRSSKWWDNKSKSMYEDCFKEAGFYEKNSIDGPGDAIIFNVGASTVINHAAVYCGNGLFAHHLMGRLSILDRLDRYISNSKVHKRIVGYDEKSDISRRNAENFRRAILI